MTEFVVHGVPGSPYVQAVLMVLEEKRLPWRLQSIPIGTNRTPAYRPIHPFQKIPSIDHGDFPLYETLAILNYIDGVQPDPALRPQDIRQAARVDQVISIVNAYVASRLSGAVTFPLVIAPQLGLPLDGDAARAAVPAAREVVDELARLLGGKAYFAGPDLSLADLMLAPHFAFLPNFPEGEAMIADHANLRGWIDRLKARPSFSATERRRLLERFPMPPVAA